MAKNENSRGGMVEGLFTTNRKIETSNSEPVLEMDIQKEPENPDDQKNVERGAVKHKKIGRPRDSDLKDGEAIRSTTIQLTDKTIYKLDAYLLDHKPKTRSQVIRELINKHL